MTQNRGRIYLTLLAFSMAFIFAGLPRCPRIPPRIALSGRASGSTGGYGDDDTKGWLFRAHRPGAEIEQTARRKARPGHQAERSFPPTSRRWPVPTIRKAFCRRRTLSRSIGRRIHARESYEHSSHGTDRGRHIEGVSGFGFAAAAADNHRSAEDLARSAAHAGVDGRSDEG